MRRGVIFAMRDSHSAAVMGRRAAIRQEQNHHTARSPEAKPIADFI